jgi:AbrB family looped-hinge helix DNA binding protein
MMSGHGSTTENGTDCGHHHGHHGIGKMLGTTSISERGQVVIPDKARKELGIEGDDMFVVFGNKSIGSLILVKSEVFEKLTETFMSKMGMPESHTRHFFPSTDEADQPDGGAVESESGDDAVDGGGGDGDESTAAGVTENGSA